MLAFMYPWALLLAIPAAWLVWRSRRPSTETFSVANLFLWSESATVAVDAKRERRSAPPWLVWLQAAVISALAIAIAHPVLPGSQPTAALIVDVSPSMSARDTTTTRADLARAEADRWRSAHAAETQTLVVEASDLVPAIESARRQTSGAVTVITDLPAPSEAGEYGIVWQQIGAPADNLAITALDARADGGAILEVSNFGISSRNVTTNISDGSTSRTEQFEIEAEGIRSFSIAAGPDRTVTAELRLTGTAGNALTSDDRRSVRTKRAAPVTLVLAHDDSRVQAAASALTDVTVIAPGQDEPASSVWMCGIKCAAPAGSAKLVFTAGGTVPRIDRAEVAGARTVTVAVDLTTSPWPLTPAFPVFVADAIDWLANRPASTLSSSRINAINESNTLAAPAPILSESDLGSPASASRPLWWMFAVFAVAGALIDLALRRRFVAFRLAAIAAVAAAVAGLTLPFGGSQRHAVLLVDSSASVSGSSRAANERIRRETAALPSGDQLSVVRFGGTSTNIAAGIRRARASLPSGGDRRILLVTDGQQTLGNAIEEARVIGAASLPIDVAPIDSRVPAFIERFDAPATSRAAAPVQLRLSLKGRPREIVNLAVSRDGIAIDSRRVALDDEGSASLTITDTPINSGVSFYRAVLSDDQIGVTLSESGAAVTITGRTRILVISERSAFRQAVGAVPAEIVEVQPAAAPGTREALGGFSAIVLDAIAPHQLSTRQLDAIATAVAADGAGLLVLGGRGTLDAAEFTAGGFADSLPVDFTVLPNPPSTASSVALLVDISGSMAATSDGVTKISAARDAIARTLSIVPKTDAITVIGFAAQPTTLIGPNEARDPAAVTAKLAPLAPSGSTSLAPAVSEAVQWLKSTPNRRRRLLLVTDGKTSVSDADAARRAVLGEGIEVSAITIGADAEREWLAALAAATGGRAFFPERLTDLAREVAREAGRGASGREINEPFNVSRGAHALAPPDPAPSLGGYIAGRLRDGATAAWKSRSGDAVLAAWPRGTGRVATFSAELGGTWGEPLRRWPGNAIFWQRAIHWLARSSEPAAIDADLSFAIDGPRVVVELPDSATNAGALPSVRVSLAGPSGRTTTIALHAVSRTRFEAGAPLDEAGDYRSTITVTDAAGPETRAARGWFWTGDLESQSRGLNTAVLEEIARVSGGRLLPLFSASAANDSVWSAPRARGRVNAVPWLMLAALSLLSLDYLRRSARASS